MFFTFRKTTENPHMLKPVIKSLYNLIRQKEKLKRDHGYTQQKRLNYERAMNKYSRNLQENNTTTKFITNIIYYITKKLQINWSF